MIELLLRLLRHWFPAKTDAERAHDLLFGGEDEMH